MLGIGKETAKFHLDKEKLKDFDVFVQSTSYNRVLMPDTEFLYDTGEGGTASSAAVSVTPAAPVTSGDTKDEPSTSRGTGRGKRKKAEEEVSDFCHYITALIKLQCKVKRFKLLTLVVRRVDNTIQQIIAIQWTV